MKPNSPIPIITYQLWYFQWRWFSPLQVPSNSQRLTKGTASTVTSSQPRKFRRPPRPRPSQLRSRGPMVEARIVSPVPSLWCSLSWFLSNPAYDCLPHSVYHVHFENHKVTWVACPFSSRTFNSVHIFISPPALVSAWVSSSNNALYVEPKTLSFLPVSTDFHEDVEVQDTTNLSWKHANEKRHANYTLTIGSVRCFSLQHRRQITMYSHHQSPRFLVYLSHRNGRSDVREPVYFFQTLTTYYLLTTKNYGTFDTISVLFFFR